MITLIVGGVRSGKSRYAQALAKEAENVVFLATAEAADDEMRAKIARHRRERPETWRTVEVPIDLDAAITQYGRECELLIVDCLTTFTANVLAADGDNHDQVLARVERVCTALKQTGASVALVSNEVGSGIVPAYPSGRQFRDLLGEINQRVAELADRVVFMVAGCFMVIKGAAQVSQ